MLFKSRYLHLDLKTQTHSIGETSPELMNLDLTPENIAKKLVEEKRENISEGDVLLINMPYDQENYPQGWLVTHMKDLKTIRLYHYPERFANALHRSTFDYIIISGSSDEPVYVYLSDMLVLFENPEEIQGLAPAQAANKLVENHPWVEPEVMIAGSDSTLNFISDRYSLPGLGAALAAKKMLALVVDGSDPES